MIIDSILNNPESNHLCVLAKIEMIFEEEGKFTVVIKPDMHEILNGYLFTDFVSFHFSKNNSQQMKAYKRYLEEVESIHKNTPNGTGMLDKRYLFVFSKRFNEITYNSFWHFEFLFDPNDLVALMSSPSQCFNSDSAIEMEVCND